MSDSATASRAGDSQVLESKLLMRRVTRMTSNTFNGNPMAFLMSDTKSVVESESSAQSDPEGAVLLSKDLKESHGDSVKIDMLHQLKGRAVMGERNITDKEEGILRSQFSLRIDQARKPVYAGSRMAQQRRGYPLRRASRLALDEWWKNYYGELFFYHMAGMRGKYYEDDIIFEPREPEFGDGMPLDEYSEDFVNDLMPPTFDRHMFAGSADSIDGANPLTPTDTMDLETLKRAGVKLQTMSYPLGAIRLATDEKPMDTDPLYVGLLTPEQFKDVEDSSPEFAQLQANARDRVRGFNHELFKNDCFMIENVLWRKYFRPIRSYAGDIINVSNNDKDATVTQAQVPGNVPQVDRAMILGRQALALALAGDTNGIVFHTDEEPFDMNDKYRYALRWMGGLRKIRQRTRSGKAYDTGVMVIDSVSNAV